MPDVYSDMHSQTDRFSQKYGSVKDLSGAH